MDSERDRIVGLFGTTHLGESLAELSRIYDQVEEESSSFCRSYNIHCTSGCGSCCEHFMPDVTPLEARMIAAYLLLKPGNLPLISRVQEGHDHCPLYDENNPYHCQVYSVRPLICRLFGQCASRMKDGSAVFHRCRFEGGRKMPEKLEFSEDSDIRTMDVYGIMVRSLDSGSGDEVSDLDDALISALSEVSMIASYLGLSSGSDDGDDSTPTPSPQAS